jgi:hypothetical protein
MVRLPAIMFAAAITIWGLASIPDGNSNDKTSRAFRPTTPDEAFLTPTQKRPAFAFRDARSPPTLALR